MKGLIAVSVPLTCQWLSTYSRMPSQIISSLLFIFGIWRFSFSIKCPHFKLIKEKWCVFPENQRILWFLRIIIFYREYHFMVFLWVLLTRSPWPALLLVKGGLYYSSEDFWQLPLYSSHWWRVASNLDLSKLSLCLSSASCLKFVVSPPRRLSQTLAETVRQTPSVKPLEQRVDSLPLLATITTQCSHYKSLPTVVKRGQHRSLITAITTWYSTEACTHLTSMVKASTTPFKKKKIL